MITREALDKVRDTQADDATQFCRCAGFTCSGCEEKTRELYARAFTAAVSLLWPVIEAAHERNLDSFPELKQAIAQLKERVKHSPSSRRS